MLQLYVILSYSLILFIHMTFNVRRYRRLKDHLESHHPEIYQGFSNPKKMSPMKAFYFNFDKVADQQALANDPVINGITQGRKRATVYFMLATTLLTVFFSFVL